MNRTLVGFSLVLLVAGVLGAGLIWLLALASTGVENTSIVTREVSRPSTLIFADGPQIEAASEEEAYFMLGYAHGREHPWPLSLLRQTALGRLGEWFGEPTLELDRVARGLRFGPGAEAAVRRLPADDARILAAYARGVTEAFSDRDVLLDEQLALFGVVPEPWEPRHSIAIERMMAWLSQPPVVPSAADTAYAALASFETADRSLRNWLHLHGAEFSSVWTGTDSLGSLVQAQFVYGATALVQFEPARVSFRDTVFSGISLLGTPFFPFATGAGGTWITLLSSTRTVANRFDLGVPDSVELENSYERLVLRSGDERLLKVSRLGDRLFFSDESFTADDPSDPVWGAVEWHGLAPISDWPAWRARARAASGARQVTRPGFRLVEGTGMSVDADGNVNPEGRPVVFERAGGNVYLAMHRLRRFAAQRFLERARGGALEAAAGDLVSGWAEANVTIALDALRPDSVYSPRVHEAIDYLRNWDYGYDLASIGASLFDAWMGAFTRHRDPYPGLVISGDSLQQAETRTQLEEALVLAVDSLVRVAGPDLARWRLESFRKGAREFPVWSYPPLAESLPGVNRLRFAPISIQQPGHPTTVAWESGLFDYPSNSPAHAVARIRIGNSESFSYRKDYLIGDGLVSRHVATPPEDGPTLFVASTERARIIFRPAP